MYSDIVKDENGMWLLYDSRTHELIHESHDSHTILSVKLGFDLAKSSIADSIICESCGEDMTDEADPEGRPCDSCISQVFEDEDAYARMVGAGLGDSR